MADKKSKKEKAKGFFKNNKKKCIFALLVIVSAVAYIFFDVDLNVDSLVEKICNFVGC